MEALKVSLPATGTVDYLWTRDFIMWSFFWIRTPSGMTFLNIPGSAPWSAGFVTPGAVLPDYPAHRSISRDNIFLLNRDAPGIQEEINRLTWHLSDMVRDRHHVTAPEARVLESSVW
ncbi:hypothetical protein NAE50_003763 [Salmonella enterica]|nr:hypothetical protein [Salmonella enterica]ELX2842995.1 hypothetical protein [Salmonella enterica]